MAVSDRGDQAGHVGHRLHVVHAKDMHPGGGAPGDGGGGAEQAIRRGRLIEQLATAGCTLQALTVKHNDGDA